MGTDNNEGDVWFPRVKCHIFFVLSKQDLKSLVSLTRINVVQCISHSVKAFKEVIVIDPLCVGAHPVLMTCDPDGRVHLLHGSSCCVTLHFLLAERDDINSQLHFHHHLHKVLVWQLARLKPV